MTIEELNKLKSALSSGGVDPYFYRDTELNFKGLPAKLQQEDNVSSDPFSVKSDFSVFDDFKPQVDITPQDFRNANNIGTGDKNSYGSLFNMPYTGSGDMHTNLFNVGNSLAFDSSLYPEEGRGMAKTGNAMVGIASGLKAWLGITRDILSGFANGKKTNRTMSDYYKKQREGMVGNYTYMEEGGEVGAKELAEVEGGEYIHRDGVVTEEVTGNKHKNGGVMTMLSPTDRVISDKVKLGGKAAKIVRDSFGLNVKATDTFATVLDKFRRTSGLTKLEKEEQALISKLDKLNKIKNESTRALNLKFVENKLKEIEDKKLKLKKLESDLTGKIYSLQESKKGSVPALDERKLKLLAKQFGVSVDEVKQLLSERGINKYEEGGEPIVSSKKLRNNFTDDQKEKILAFYSQFLPEDVISKLKGGDIDINSLYFNKDLLNDIFSGKKVNVGSQHRTNKWFGGVDEDRISNFTLKDYIESKYGENFDFSDKKRIKEIQDEYNLMFKNKFGGDYKSGINNISDGLFGNRTSAYFRTTEKIPAKNGGYIDVDKILPLINKKGGKDEINSYLKDYGITFDDIKDKINPLTKVIELSPQSGEDISLPNVTKDHWVYDGGIGDEHGTNLQTGKGGTNYGGLFMPDQHILAPGSVNPHLKVNRTYDRLDPVKLSPDRAIKEAFRSEDFVASQLNNIPDSARRASLTNLAANTQDGINNIVQSVNVANAQNKQFADRINLQQSNAEENMRASDALNYEARQLGAVAKTEEQLQRWFDYNRKLDLLNFNTQHKQRLLNQLFDNYNIDSFGGVEYDPTNQVDFVVSRNDYKVEDKKKRTKKTKK